MKYLLQYTSANTGAANDQGYEAIEIIGEAKSLFNPNPEFLIRNTPELVAGIVRYDGRGRGAYRMYMEDDKVFTTDGLDGDMVHPLTRIRKTAAFKLTTASTRRVMLKFKNAAHELVLLEDVGGRPAHVVEYRFRELKLG